MTKMGNKVSISHSAELKTIYIHLAGDDAKIARTSTRDFGDKTVNVDFDENDEIVGVEII